MTESKKIFLDTTPIIYLLDEDVNYAKKVEKIFTEILKSDKSMITSTITCTEYLIYPYRTGNLEKVNVFFEFLTECSIPMLPINVEIAKRAASIRAEYKDFKTMDALQLAVAYENQCNLFLTNDKQLRQFKNLKCITVDEWK